MSRALSKAITPQWYSVPVGGVIVIDDSDPNAQIPPQTHDDVVYVKLTAGLMDAGEYNEGKLTNEVISSTGPNIVATAEIAVGPEAGRTINLLNSENRYLMPGEVSGAVADDQMQQITGEITSIKIGSSVSASGAFSATTTTGSSYTSSSIANGDFAFDSANSTDARTGDHTNVKHQEVTAFRRIA